MPNGIVAEVGTVGNEGISGVEVLINADLAINTYVVQIPGKALGIAVADFKSAMKRMPDLRLMAFSYLQGYFFQMNRSAACNRRHTLEGRFARWMLLTQDRVADDEFQLLPESIAEMLGIELSSVSLIAGQFQRAGLISYSRNQVQILNREGLEEVSCECYLRVRSQFQ